MLTVTSDINQLVLVMSYEKKNHILLLWSEYRGSIVCSTRYRTRHFFNNSNSNEDIATKFEQEYVRCVRNEKECVCSAYNCCDKAQRSAS